MKFKDAYQNNNNAVHVREDLLEEIKMERVERVRLEQQKRERRKKWLIAIPAVATAAAACIAVVIGVSAKNGKKARTAQGQGCICSPTRRNIRRFPIFTMRNG